MVGPAVMSNALIARWRKGGVDFDLMVAPPQTPPKNVQGPMVAGASRRCLAPARRSVTARTRAISERPDRQEVPIK